jgi:hypothetical protein
VSQSGLGDQLGNKTTAHAGLDVSHSHRPLDLPLDSCPTDALLVADLLVATRRRRQGASTQHVGVGRRWREALLACQPLCSHHATS